MLILLIPVMIWQWLSSAILFYLILGRPWVRLHFLGLQIQIESLIMAACTAPTDPILANSIVNGRFADMHIPVPIRQLLSAESAVNDGNYQNNSQAGMALPFFTISILLFQMPIGEAFAQWAWQTWAYEMSLAIVLGTLIGYASRYMLRYSETHNFIDKRNFFSFEIALTVRFLNQKAHAHSFSSWDWQASFTFPPLSPSWLRVSRLHGTGGLPPKQRKHMYKKSLICFSI